MREQRERKSHSTLIMKKMERMETTTMTSIASKEMRAVGRGQVGMGRSACRVRRVRKSFPSGLLTPTERENGPEARAASPAASALGSSQTTGASGQR